MGGLIKFPAGPVNLLSLLGLCAFCAFFLTNRLCAQGNEIPEVTVDIGGWVEKPHIYTVRNNCTIEELIVVAGGFHHHKKNDTIKYVFFTRKGQERIQIRKDEWTDQKASYIPLQEGDFINVPLPIED